MSRLNDKKLFLLDMDVKIEKLLKGIKDCPCGLPHECNISDVIIKRGAINYLPLILNKYCCNNIVLVSDNNTYKTCGEEILKKLNNLNFNVINMMYTCKGLLVPDENAIMQLSKRISKDTEIIVGIGSGVINDLCKYASITANLPYIIIATAPSMDGYASLGAAMIISNMKVTYSAHVPKAIIGDVNILKEAPVDLIKAGFKMSDFYTMYGKEMIKNSILYAKDLKDRYTLFWLLHDVGLLYTFSEKYDITDVI